MWTWLSKIDPNFAISALTFVGTAAGWAWRKVRGQEQASFATTINRAIDNLVLEAFDALGDDGPARVNVQGYLRATRAKVEASIWTVLAKRGIPRNRTTERLVHEATERATAELAREITERRKRASETRDPRVTVSK